MGEKRPAFADADPFSRAPARRKPRLPGAADIAAMLRDGELLEDLADTFGRSANSLRQILGNAGWSATTGYPLDPPKGDSDVDDDPPSVGPFKPPAWMDDAVCASTDPELFFPEKGGNSRDAKALCGTCPVSAECLDDALERGERFGIWGGLSERERRKIHALITSQEEAS